MFGLVISVGADMNLFWLIMLLKINQGIMI